MSGHYEHTLQNSDGAKLHEQIATLVNARTRDPEGFRQGLARRARRSFFPDSDRLLIVAADHTARGVTHAAPGESQMGNRFDLLERIRRVLTNPRVDGVLATLDILEDLGHLGYLDNKLAIAAINRGGLHNSAGELNDTFTGVRIGGSAPEGIDGVKLLLRIALDDPQTSVVLERAASAVDQAVAWKIPILLEPFMSAWEEGSLRNKVDAQHVAQAIAIASGLGRSSAYSWLKLPITDNVEEVVSASTLPIMWLGGQSPAGMSPLMDAWRHSLSFPTVKGLVIGRSLLYPTGDSIEERAHQMSEIIHPSPTQIHRSHQGANPHE